MGRSDVILVDHGFEKRLRRAIRTHSKYALDAVTKSAIDLAEKSARLAPIDKGDLRNDCTATVNGVVVYENQAPTGSRPRPSKTPSAMVSYSLPYAMRQHEELSYRHPQGGQAKYLEEPFLANAGRYAEMIQEGVIDGLARHT